MRTWLAMPFLILGGVFMTLAFLFTEEPEEPQLGDYPGTSEHIR